MKRSNPDTRSSLKTRITKTEILNLTPTLEKKKKRKLKRKSLRDLFVK